ncbi:MAG: KUP/HAK/KT family potassium transporter [Deltaproteobacteria bacterium]
MVAVSPGKPGLSIATRRDARAERELILGLGALGVVYGDLGTNPLFALRECFASTHPVAVVPANVLGAVSLALWALILVICIKYTVFILRADNEGEGGTLALLGKIPPRMRDGVASRPLVLVMVLLFGSALLLGDGIVTPAISVLSAVEGLGVEQPRVVLYTAIILIALFAAQRFGTARVGAVFGPVMLLWFATIAVLGAVQIAQQPEILRAIDPRYAIALLRSGQPGSYLVLNAIILVVAGGEALYADLGHFGRRPIVRAWYWVVLPALALVYTGQGALLLRDPHAIENPFFAMAPDTLRVPLVVLATAATVIASQALISGAFSLARQGINLGFLPRMKISHTSNEETGQIYVSAVNTLLAIGCLALVFGFGSSAKLAGAYGLAVNGTMTATTFGFFFVMWKVWRRPLVLCIALAACFFAIDLAFLGANVTKLFEGGWVPLTAGGALFGVAMIWRWGRRTIARAVGGRAIPVDELFARDDVRAVPRVPGTAVFLTSALDGVPPILVHHVERNGALHEQVVLLSLQVLDVPFVEPRRRLAETELGRGFFRVVARYGYADSPNVPALLEACAILGLAVDFDRITYVVGRDALRLRYDHGPFSIPRRVFAFLSRNQAPAVGYFGMPVERVIEIGMQIQL